MSKKIIAFDLSSVCIGVVTAEVEKDKVVKIGSCPIVPKPFDPTTLGFQKSKKKLPSKNGSKSYNTWWKEGETTISQKEKKHRDSFVREQKNLYLLQHITLRLNNIIRAIQPDVILVEKNMIFNGILTSVLLGQVMATLLSVGALYGIDVKQYRVDQVRSILPIADLQRDLVKDLDKETILTIPDITKRAIKVHFERLYGFEMHTDDEGDACAVFHYYFETEYKKGDGN